MTVDDLDKLLELEAKATQGPWALEIDTAPFALFLDNRFTDLDREDIELISAMRNNIKELCTELRAAREVVEAARSALDDMDVMFRTTERLEAALKTYDEARRG